MEGLLCTTNSCLGFAKHLLCLDISHTDCTNIGTLGLHTTSVFFLPSGIKPFPILIYICYTGLIFTKRDFAQFVNLFCTKLRRSSHTKVHAALSSYDSEVFFKCFCFNFVFIPKSVALFFSFSMLMHSFQFS